MTVIELQTLIRAPRERVFDLARSIDAHQDSTEGTQERAVGGVKSGLIGCGEEVTWEARHLGVRQRLTVRVTRVERPKRFQDVMIRGAFKHMQHDRTFDDIDGQTRMTDRFEFSAPLGFLGVLAERLFLANYMRRFIVRRNAILKRMAESEEWRKYFGS